MSTYAKILFFCLLVFNSKNSIAQIIDNNSISKPFTINQKDVTKLSSAQKSIIIKNEGTIEKLTNVNQPKNVIINGGKIYLYFENISIENFSAINKEYNNTYINNYYTQVINYTDSISIYSEQNMDMALEFANKNIQLQIDSNKSELRKAIAYTEKALIFSKHKLTDSSLLYLKKVENLDISLQNKEIGLLFYKKARIYQNIDSLKQSFFYDSLSLNINKNSLAKNSEFLASNYSNLAYHYLLKKDFKKCIEYAELSNETSKNNETENLNYIGQSLFHLNKFDAAIQSALNSKNIALLNKDTIYIYQNNTLLCYNYIKTAEILNLKKCLSENENLISSQNNPSLLINKLYFLGQYFYIKEDYDSSEYYFKELINLRDLKENYTENNRTVIFELFILYDTKIKLEKFHEAFSILNKMNQRNDLHQFDEFWFIKQRLYLYRLTNLETKALELIDRLEKKTSSSVFEQNYLFIEEKINYAQLNENKKALKNKSKFIKKIEFEKDTLNQIAYFNFLANNYEKIKDLEKSKFYYYKSIEQQLLNPKKLFSFSTYHELVFILYNEKKYDEILHYSDKLLELQNIKLEDRVQILDVVATIKSKFINLDFPLEEYVEIIELTNSKNYLSKRHNALTEIINHYLGFLDTENARKYIDIQTNEKYLLSENNYKSYLINNECIEAFEENDIKKLISISTKIENISKRSNDLQFKLLNLYNAVLQKSIDESRLGIAKIYLFKIEKFVNSFGDLLDQETLAYLNQIITLLKSTLTVDTNSYNEVKEFYDHNFNEEILDKDLDYDFLFVLGKFHTIEKNDSALNYINTLISKLEQNETINSGIYIKALFYRTQIYSKYENVDFNAIKSDFKTINEIFEIDEVLHSEFYHYYKSKELKTYYNLNNIVYFDLKYRKYFKDCYLYLSNKNDFEKSKNESQQIIESFEFVAKSLIKEKNESDYLEMLVNIISFEKTNKYISLYNAKFNYLIKDFDKMYLELDKLVDFDKSNFNTSLASIFEAVSVENKFKALEKRLGIF